MGQNLCPRIELHAKPRVRQRLGHSSTDHKRFLFLRHTRSPTHCRTITYLSKGIADQTLRLAPITVGRASSTPYNPLVSLPLFLLQPLVPTSGHERTPIQP